LMITSLCRERNSVRISGKFRRRPAPHKLSHKKVLPV
jgi:hypothetical protein